MLYRIQLLKVAWPNVFRNNALSRIVKKDLLFSRLHYPVELRSLLVEAQLLISCFVVGVIRKIYATPQAMRLIYYQQVIFLFGNITWTDYQISTQPRNATHNPLKR